MPAGMPLTAFGVTPAQARAPTPRPPPPAAPPCSMRSIAYETGGVRAAWCEEPAWRSAAAAARRRRMRPLRRALLLDVAVDVVRGAVLLSGLRRDLVPPPRPS